MLDFVNVSAQTHANFFCDLRSTLPEARAFSHSVGEFSLGRFLLGHPVDCPRFFHTSLLLLYNVKSTTKQYSAAGLMKSMVTMDNCGFIIKSAFLSRGPSRTFALSHQQSIKVHQNHGLASRINQPSFHWEHQQEFLKGKIHRAFQELLST